MALECALILGTLWTSTRIQTYSVRLTAMHLIASNYSWMMKNGISILQLLNKSMCGWVGIIQYAKRCHQSSTISFLMKWSGFVIYRWLNTCIPQDSILTTWFDNQHSFQLIFQLNHIVAYKDSEEQNLMRIWQDISHVLRISLDPMNTKPKLIS